MESKPIHYLKEIIDTEFDIDLKEKTRRREYTEARAIFCKILKKYNRVGPTKLADFLGVHHATPIHTQRLRRHSTLQQHQTPANTNNAKHGESSIPQHLHT